jgi:pyridoxine 5-phosphate synthase
MARLSVNINKIATLRNARGGVIPDVVLAAVNCQRFGAQGITIHPRPDERHIRRQDVYDIKPVITTEFNIEGYPSDDFIRMVINIKADQATLVPDKHNQLTSDHGWDTIKHRSFLTDVISQMKEHGIRTSIFVDPDVKAVEGAARIGTDRVELYTEPYASTFPADREKAIAPFVEAAKAAAVLGIGINAGHDLNLDNLNYLYKNIPNLLEVSIGHALIADALYFGLEATIKKYLDCLK